MKIAPKILVLGIAVLALWLFKKEYDLCIEELKFLYKIQLSTPDGLNDHSGSHLQYHQMKNHPITDTIRFKIDQYYRDFKKIKCDTGVIEANGAFNLSRLKTSFDINNQQLSLQRQTSLVLSKYYDQLELLNSKRLLELVKPTIHIANNHQNDSIKVGLRLIELYDSIYLNYANFHYKIGNKKVDDYIPCVSKAEIDGVSVIKVIDNDREFKIASKWY